MNELARLLFLMGAAHALCDFALQSPAMSGAKRPGGDPFTPWQAALACHAMIHGGAVALITGIWWLGLAEAAAHAAIDRAKCRGLFGMKTDQGLHLLCKLAWAAIALALARG